jgi:hypothetical protein
VVGQEDYAVFALRNFRRQLDPLAAWLAGDRSSETGVDAWRAAASVPLELLRQ